VDGRMNGIMVKGNAAGVTMYYGAGAGARETASAVVADLVDLARALRGGGRMCVPALGFHEGAAASPVMAARGGVRSRNYLRLGLDGPDAGARALDAMARHGVPAAKGVQSHNTLVVLTQEVPESSMAVAMRELGAMAGVQPGLTRLRVEALDQG